MRLIKLAGVVISVWAGVFYDPGCRVAVPIMILLPLGHFVNGVLNCSLNCLYEPRCRAAALQLLYDA